MIQLKPFLNSCFYAFGWKKLLKQIGIVCYGSQPIHVEDISTFNNATRLFYSNDDVATFNYNKLINIPGPIAQINARHSFDKVN